VCAHTHTRAGSHAQPEERILLYRAVSKLCVQLRCEGDLLRSAKRYVNKEPSKESSCERKA